jgi:hypothetical protein
MRIFLFSYPHQICIWSATSWRWLESKLVELGMVGGNHSDKYLIQFGTVLPFMTCSTAWRRLKLLTLLTGHPPSGLLDHPHRSLYPPLVLDRGTMFEVTSMRHGKISKHEVIGSHAITPSLPLHKLMLSISLLSTRLKHSNWFGGRYLPTMKQIRFIWTIWVGTLVGLQLSCSLSSPLKKEGTKRALVQGVIYLYRLSHLDG